MLSNYYHTNEIPPEQARSPDDPSDQISPRSTNTDVSLSMMTDYNSITNPAKESQDGNQVEPQHYDLQSIQEEEESAAQVALLLTSMSDIASKELKEADPQQRKPIMDAALTCVFPRFPDLGHALSKMEVADASANPDYVDLTGARDMDCANIAPNPGSGNIAPSSPTLLHFNHKKTRAVSMDSPELRGMMKTPPHEEDAIPTLLQWRNRSNSMGENAESNSSPPHHGIFWTPPPSPRVPLKQSAVPNSEHRRFNVPAIMLSVAESVKTNRPRAVSLAEGSRTGSGLIPHLPLLDSASKSSGKSNSGSSSTPKKLILRKKFSWKNYPELEEFLIANREEYLRHSTLNYTMQQKKYNNCLTERMIQLAADHGYAFDEHDFSFVTVRDRIRCYFKSYVQSMKKRGVVIGYAARKAGLVTEQELEQSAHTSGKIYVPRG